MKISKSLIAIIAVVVIIGAWAASAYNSMVGVQEQATTALANVQSTYQRRADLIPNLVETVKGYAAHEKQTLEDVVAARTKATSINLDASTLTPEKLKEFQQAQGELGSALGRLIAIQENYPDLKANENFRDLQVQLEGTENRINEARNKYNQASSRPIMWRFVLSPRTSLPVSSALPRWISSRQRLERRKHHRLSFN